MSSLSETPPVFITSTLPHDKFGIDVVRFLFNMCQTYSYSVKRDEYYASVVFPSSVTTPKLQMTFNVTIRPTFTYRKSSAVRITDIRVICSDMTAGTQEPTKTTIQLIYKWVLRELVENISIINETCLNPVNQ